MAISKDTPSSATAYLGPPLAAHLHMPDPLLLLAKHGAALQQLASRGSIPSIRIRFSLGVTEPDLLYLGVLYLVLWHGTAGSDVADIKTMAARKGDGYYVADGSKKWITNGTWADNSATV